MAERQDDRLLDHSYDGIQEYDNPMPRWWVWVFWATIGFSVAYFFLPAPFGAGPGKVAEYEASVARQQATPPAQGAPAVTDDQLTRLAGDAAALADGKTVFEANCAACHRADGGGSVGPNLTDEYWLHGGAPDKIWKTVAEGVPAKGMPAWKPQLGPDRVQAVTAYVLTLRNSNVPGGTPPEGAREALSQNP